MANKKIWLGILVMVLVFGMTVVGCDDDSTNGNGKGGGACPHVTARCNNNSTCKAGNCEKDYCTSYGCICP